MIATISGHEARLRLKKGVDLMVDTAKVTLGPYGRNVGITKDGEDTTTNDGYTILTSMLNDKKPWRDKVAWRGAKAVQKISQETNAIAGDATTTSAVLSQSLFDICIEELKDGTVNSIILSRQLQEAVDVAAGKLDKLAVKLTNDMILDVARVAVGGDEGLAQLVTKAVKRAGSGPITMESVEKLGTEVEVTEGMQDVGGLASPYMAVPGSDTRVIQNAPVLVIDGTLDDYQHIFKLLHDVIKAGHKDLVVYATDFSNSVVKFMNDQPTLKPVAIRAMRMRDIAEAVGATPISQVGTARLEHIDISHLGTAKRIHATPVDSLVSGKSGKGKLKVANIKLGYPTADEFNEKALRVEDAINAVRGAQESGVLTGGGVALAKASKEIKLLGTGELLLAEAMLAPQQQIKKNGFDGEVGPGVIDSHKAVVTALRNAVSGVSTLITQEVITYEEDDWDE